MCAVWTIILLMKVRSAEGIQPFRLWFFVLHIVIIIRHIFVSPPRSRSRTNFSWQSQYIIFSSYLNSLDCVFLTIFFTLWDLKKRKPGSYPSHIEHSNKSFYTHTNIIKLHPQMLKYIKFLIYSVFIYLGLRLKKIFLVWFC